MTLRDVDPELVNGRRENAGRKIPSGDSPEQGMDTWRFEMASRKPCLLLSDILSSDSCLAKDFNSTGN